MSDDDEDDTRYTVVRNDEEQYSIWFADRPVPAGWYEVGVVDRRPECLAYIDQTWTDMRPLSLRRQMAEASGEL